MVLGWGGLCRTGNPEAQACRMLRTMVLPPSYCHSIMPGGLARQSTRGHKVLQSLKSYLGVLNPPGMSMSEQQFLRTDTEDVCR